MTDIRNLWKDQPLDDKPILDLDEVRERAILERGRFQRRNLLLYAYSLFNIVTSVWLVATGKFPNMHVPMLLMVGAHLFVLWQVWKRFGLGQPTSQVSAQEGLQHFRAELERQHSAVARAGLWYIAPFMPPLLWELASWVRLIDFETAVGQASFRAFVVVVCSAILFWGCVWLIFHRHATRLRLELERLSRLTAE